MPGISSALSRTYDRFLLERPRRTLAILLALLVYVGITVLAFFMETSAHFFALAVLVAMVQGGAQALSRSLFASMIPSHRSGEYFAFFAVGEKFAGIGGPLLFALITDALGSARWAILGIVLFFVVGGVLLLGVDVDQGRRVAREAERLAEVAPDSPPRG